MKEIKCPNCGTSFTVDDNDYAAILSQVKTREFQEEVERRMKEITGLMDEKSKVQDQSLKQKYEKSLNDKQLLLDRLENKIQRLEDTIANFDKIKEAEIGRIKADNRNEIEKLKSQRDNDLKQHKIDLSDIQRDNDELIHQKEQTITRLQSTINNQQAEADNRVLALKEQHEIQLRGKQEEIDRLKDFKTRLSTKMLGETLEQHCAISFANAQSMGIFPDAKFEKDNDIHTGTKGDFIFRDYIGDDEYISVMFEMKNEADTTAIKHKNTDFLEKLHKDRSDKKCEYAVLVTMLELNNPLYDNGMVDMSHLYPKMFIIRPAFFLPLLRILTQAARRNIDRIITLSNQLQLAREQSLDVAKFEEKLNRFKTSFDNNVTAAHKKYEAAITGIDKVIADLEKQISTLRSVKSNFEASEQKLLKANQIVDEDFTIKKLTHGNPRMRERFNQAHLTQPDNIHDKSDISDTDKPDE